MADPRIDTPAAVALPNQVTATVGQVAPSDIEKLWNDAYSIAHKVVGVHQGKNVPQYHLWTSHAQLVEPSHPSDEGLGDIIILRNVRPGCPMITGSLRGKQEYGSNHGGGYLYQLLQLNKGDWSATFKFQRKNPYEEQLYPGTSIKALRDYFLAERRMLEYPEPGQFPKLYTAFDAFRHLEIWIDFVPQAEWGESWKNFRGKPLTFNNIMATTTSSYVEPKTEVNGSSDHGLLHLPQILLRYHTMRGGGAVLKQIQQAFLNRELAEPIKKMWSVNSDKGMKIFHYAETLGVMLDHPDLTWTEDNIAKVKGWLIQMREFVAENPWYLGDSETAHYYRGMKLIAKNAAKIFPKP